MSRLPAALLVTVLAAACSAGGKSTTGDPPRKPADAPPAVTSPAAAALPPPDPREVKLATTVRELLERGHLIKRPVDDDLSHAAFEEYVKRLDPGKMFLLASDLAALDRYADTIDDELRSGSLDLAHEASKLFVARVEQLDKIVAGLLAQPMNLTDAETIELDPEKLKVAQSEQELTERWRQRLELEVLERVSGMELRLDRKPGAADPDDVTDAPPVPKADIPATPEAREAKARADLAKAYAGRFARLRQPAKLDAAADLMNAIAAAYDPHTTYLPPADKANFDIAMTGSLEGIGAVLRERDHFTEVVELVPGGASWRQGRLAPGDLILSVANGKDEPVDVADMRIDEVVKMIRGPKGTVVRLHVQKPTGVEETIAITRDVVVIEETYARGALLTPGKGKAPYGYIYLPSFYGGQGPGQRTASGDVRKLLGEMKKKGVAGVVIDIRSNGGGYLGDAVELTGLLIDQGPVVQVQDSAGRHEVLDDDEAGTVYDGPVVVMVDKFSASASEIVAGALQDYKRAVIVGTGATHGKGTVQSLIDLDRAAGGQDDLGVLKLTIQQFFRVSGASTQREGVVPDVVLPDPAGHLDTGERTLDHAVPWKKIDAARFAPWPGASWKPDQLVARSKERVGKSPVFGKIAARTQLLVSLKNDSAQPLARDAWDTWRKERKAALDATEPQLDKGPPRMTVVVLDEDTAKLAPGPGGKTDDRLGKWKDALARDPWVEESLHVLADMSGKPGK